MTWEAVTSANTTFSSADDVGRDYVVVGYVEDDYILGLVWAAVTSSSVVWT